MGDIRHDDWRRTQMGSWEAQWWPPLIFGVEEAPSLGIQGRQWHDMTWWCLGVKFKHSKIMWLWRHPIRRFSWILRAFDGNMMALWLTMAHYAWPRDHEVLGKEGLYQDGGWVHHPEGVTLFVTWPRTLPARKCHHCKQEKLCSKGAEDPQDLSLGLIGKSHGSPFDLPSLQCEAKHAKAIWSTTKLIYHLIGKAGKWSLNGF